VGIPYFVDTVSSPFGCHIYLEFSSPAMLVTFFLGTSTIGEAGRCPASLRCARGQRRYCLFCADRILCFLAVVIAIYALSYSYGTAGLDLPNTVLKCLLAPWSVCHIGCILYVNGAVCFMMARRSDRRLRQVWLCLNNASYQAASVSCKTAFDCIQTKLCQCPQQLQQQQLQQQPVLSPTSAFKQLSTSSASMHALWKALACKLPQGPHVAAVGTLSQVRDSWQNLRQQKT
jgi:hypothetical protein